MADELRDVTYDDEVLCPECGEFGAWVERAGVYCANCGADLTPPEPPLSYYAEELE